MMLSEVPSHLADERVVLKAFHGGCLAIESYVAAVIPGDTIHVGTSATLHLEGSRKGYIIHT